MNRSVTTLGVIGLVVSSWAGSVRAQGNAEKAESPAAPAFESLDRLQRHYNQRVQETRRAVEVQRLAALERLLKAAPGSDRPAVLHSMIETAMFLEQFDRVLSLSATFLKEHAASPEVWSVRRVRYGSLIADNRGVQARREWEEASTDVDMEVWQQIIDAGMQVAEGLADAGQVDEVRAIYATIRKRFAFVPDLERVLGPKTEALAWVGRRPPALEGKDLDGRRVDLFGYHGRVVLIDFWATWCQPCIAALPELIETYEEHHDSGFEVISISLDSDVKALKQFLQRSPLPWRIICDGWAWNGPNVRNYQVSGIPATFLVDRKGKIARVGVPTRGFGPVVRRLLAEPAVSKH